MRLENTRVEKVDVDVIGKTRMPLPHELSVPPDALNVTPCWEKAWSKNLELVTHTYGYTYEPRDVVD